MRRLSLLSVLLVACGGADPVGTWEGDCAVSTIGFNATYGLTLDITGDDDGDIVGTATIDDEFGPLGAILVGERKGRNLDLDLQVQMPEGVEQEYHLQFGVQAKLRGDTLQGECILGAMGFKVSSDIVLERI